MEDENLSREDAAVKYAIGLCEQGLSQDDVANLVRDTFGEDVDPVVVAMKARDEVNKTPKKQPVTSKHDKALEEKMKKTMDEAQEK